MERLNNDNKQNKMETGKNNTPVLNKNQPGNPVNPTNPVNTTNSVNPTNPASPVNPTGSASTPKTTPIVSDNAKVLANSDSSATMTTASDSTTQFLNADANYHKHKTVDISAVKKVEETVVESADQTEAKAGRNEFKNKLKELDVLDTADQIVRNGLALEGARKLTEQGIEEFKQHVDKDWKLQDSIGKAEEAITKTEQKIENLHKDVAELNTKISELDNQLLSAKAGTPLSREQVASIKEQREVLKTELTRLTDSKNGEIVKSENFLKEQKKSLDKLNTKLDKIKETGNYADISAAFDTLKTNGYVVSATDKKEYVGYKVEQVSVGKDEFGVEKYVQKINPVATKIKTQSDALKNNEKVIDDTLKKKYQIVGLTDSTTGAIYEQRMAAAKKAIMSSPTLTSQQKAEALGLLAMKDQITKSRRNDKQRQRMGKRSSKMVNNLKRQTTGGEETAAGSGLNTVEKTVKDARIVGRTAKTVGNATLNGTANVLGSFNSRQETRVIRAQRKNIKRDSKTVKNNQRKIKALEKSGKDPKTLQDLKDGLADAKARILGADKVRSDALKKKMDIQSKYDGLRNPKEKLLNPAKQQIKKFATEKWRSSRLGGKMTKGMNAIKNSKVGKTIAKPFNVANLAKKKMQDFAHRMAQKKVVAAAGKLMATPAHLKVLKLKLGVAVGIMLIVMVVLSILANSMMASVIPIFDFEKEVNNDNTIQNLRKYEASVYNTLRKGKASNHYPQNWKIVDPTDPDDILNTTKAFKLNATEDQEVWEELLLIPKKRVDGGYKINCYYGGFIFPYTGMVDYGTYHEAYDTYDDVWVEGGEEYTDEFWFWADYDPLTREFYTYFDDTDDSYGGCLEIKKRGGSWVVVTQWDPGFTIKQCRSKFMDQWREDGIQHNVFVMEYTYITKGHWETKKVHHPAYWTYEKKEMTVIGTAGMNGNLGTFKELDVVLDTNSTAFKQAIKNVNPHFTFSLTYKGTNSKGEYTTLSVDEFYKSVLSMCYGFSKNSGGKEAAHLAYMQYLIMQVLERAEVKLDVKYYKSSSNKVTWKYDIPKDTIGAQVCTARGYDAYVTVTIILKDCGLKELMVLDGTTNAEAHSGYKKIEVYTPQSGDEDYEEWPGWIEGSDNYEMAQAIYEEELTSFFEAFDVEKKPSAYKLD